MKKMIKGSDENVKLITNIVNECDIDKSLLYVLALMSKTAQEKINESTAELEIAKFHEMFPV